MSLRFRLNLIITLLVVALTAVFAVIVAFDTRRSLQEEMNAGGKVIEQLMSSVVHNLRMERDPNAAQGRMLAFVENLGRVRAHEIFYYDSNDWLIYTSPPSVYKAGRHAPSWFARLVAPDLRTMEFSTAGARVVIVPDASRAVLDAWDDLRRLLWLVLVFLVVVNAIVFVLMGRFLRPMHHLLVGLSQMERGGFDTRLPHFELPEFESISHTFNRMAGALGQSQTENRRLASIAQQSSDAILIRDLQGNISFWNPAAERLFGWPAAEIIGESADLLIPASERAAEQSRLEILRQGRVIEHDETRLQARDGRLVEVAMSATPLVEPACDDVIGYIVSVRDITEHKRAQSAELELEQNRRLTQLIQTRLEEERRTLARELHDELGQCITAIRTIGTAIARSTQDDASDVRSNAQTIVDVAGRIYDVVHDIIRQLRPPALDNLGLPDALEDWLAGWRQHHPDIACELDLDGELNGLGETVNITVYRIVQECLTNVVRHAEASLARVAVVRRGDRVDVTVVDDGKGIGPGPDGDVARFGLLGMRERVQALGGHFELDKGPGEGLQVRVSIPLVTAKEPAPGARRRAESG